ncbi:hypothetical protein SEUCBS139899_009872 [Sporothrix eucalyptigena]
MDATVAELPDYLAEYGLVTLSNASGTLDDIDLEHQCPMDDSHLANSTAADDDDLQEDSSQVGEAGQSLLETLPLELRFMILLDIDIDLLALISIRGVSRSIMATVDSLPEYQMIRMHCPNILRAIIALDIRAYNISILYETLRTKDCSVCGNRHHPFYWEPAPYDANPGDVAPRRLASCLYLITCQRLCSACVIRGDDYFPMSVYQVSKALHLSIARVLASCDRTLPRAHMVPGHYTHQHKQARSRAFLFDRPAVRRAYQAAGLSLELCVPRRDMRTAEVSRHAAVISAPYFSTRPQVVDWGFHCALCTTNDPVNHFRTRYTCHGLINHLRELHNITEGNNDKET